MKKNAVRLWLSNIVFCTVVLLLASRAYAQKTWVSPSSGFWKDGTNWSGGTPPFSTNSVIIANPNSKVVTIDAPTPPANLTITRLTLLGTNTSTNTLIMDNV